MNIFVVVPIILRYHDVHKASAFLNKEDAEAFVDQLKIDLADDMKYVDSDIVIYEIPYHDSTVVIDDE